uniref:Uncharacterized protein n=1 Tax=Myoviridae sp. ctu2j3 TaxID=2825197 RepID=A0A8S5UI45_9CAUD|nr:MAG TPA: hypothetical protein [Myoviridae sp. ctu2j3]DAF94312.1 MAG TPA: hypothetical protein [Myoviridae sp. ctu2j3]
MGESERIPNPNCRGRGTASVLQPDLSRAGLRGSWG